MQLLAGRWLGVGAALSAVSGLFWVFWNSDRPALRYINPSQLAWRTAKIAEDDESCAVHLFPTSIQGHYGLFIFILIPRLQI